MLTIFQKKSISGSRSHPNYERRTSPRSEVNASVHELLNLNHFDDDSGKKLILIEKKANEEHKLIMLQ